MRAHIRLGRILGIEIGLHYSWFIIALLLTLSLAAHFQETNPAWGGALIWTLAVLTGGLFFAALVAHELSHAAVARARGLPVRAITLFAFGGVAQIERESEDPATEFWMAIVGPITSALIGAACLALAWSGGWRPMEGVRTPFLAMVVWLGFINILLAVFNMIPGFPLDGGRVLRAVIWWMTGNAARSTRIVVRLGQMVAIGLMVLGVVRFFGGAGIGALWIVFIGWFLMDAAGASGSQVETLERLRGVRVGDVMSRDCPVMDGLSNLQTFVDEHLLRTGRRCFAVLENGAIAGLITPHEVKEVPRERWPYTTVYEAMRPLHRLRTVGPETPLHDALEVILREDVNQLPVVAEGRLVGIVSRGHVIQFLQTRAELNA